MTTSMQKRFLVASDFDQTLSFNDSGHVLAELLGVTQFAAKVSGLAASNLVQQGGELAYLIRHDPEFRGVRREHLVETGRRVRLKSAISQLVEFLGHGVDDCRFEFNVISAAPREVVVAALQGIVAPECIYGTEFDYDDSGEVQAIRRVPAGYGKVAVLEELAVRAGIARDRIIYIGDGSSDVHVMLHVNNHDGFTIAVSENRQLAQIARATVLSDNAFSVMMPALDQVLGMRPGRIRTLLEAHGLTLNGWEKARMDRVTIGESTAQAVA